MQTLIWFLPILFIFHDFEEIIFMRVWIEKNNAQLLQKYPFVAKRMLASTGGLSTEGFAFAVAFIFIMLSAVTTYVYVTGQYLIWMAMFMVFYLHLFIHIGQAVILRSYVPALVTSVIAVIPCTAIFLNVYELFSALKIIFSSIVGLVVTAGLFMLIIKLALRFDGWLMRYREISHD